MQSLLVSPVDVSLAIPLRACHEAVDKVVHDPRPSISLHIYREAPGRGMCVR